MPTIEKSIDVNVPRSVAEISEQIPDERIAWHSTGGVQNGGVVTFHYLQPYMTRVMLQVDYAPEGMVETVGEKVGVIAGRTQGDLERFKSFIEQRGDPTGAWRGQIDNPNLR